ncbi:MAG TPA: hypothetical protein VE974_24120 [Thermoanaerobaculia bacterium]|nr:hypothetical protein [Thermoanaerobaculia bacterium]
MAVKDEGRFYDLLERLFKEIDQEQVQAEVQALREAKPNATREQLAEQLTKKAARQVATVGAAAGAAIGPLAVLAMAPDIFNLVRQQSRLVLAIAFLYDRKPNIKQRFKEVLATLAVSTGSSAGGLAARVLVKEGLERAAATKLARKILGRFLARRIPNIAPVIGTIAGGSLNYLAMRAVGKAAVAYYADSPSA